LLENLEGENMTMKRSGSVWMPANDYGRTMPKFSVNLLVRDIPASVAFYGDVLGAAIVYADTDFAALNLAGAEFMLHADHTYDHHPLHARLQAHGLALRGTGAELRVMGVDPDAVQDRAQAAGATIIQRAADFPHGWRDVIVADPDGYIWAVGLPK
jgi:uncharacterized glyoxalase superfamily protein PhnB